MIRVMIADDNEIIRDDIREKLESAGFAVSASLPSGAEAAAAYNPASTDAVLMDIEMESALAGIDAARNILAASFGMWIDGLHRGISSMYESALCVKQPFSDL